MFRKKNYQQFEEINIKKPLYDNFCYIYNAVLKLAIRHRRLLKIKIPQGIAIHNPRQWMKTGKRMEKVFLRPDEPMILYGNYVKIEKPKSEEESIEEMSRLGVFG